MAKITPGTEATSNADSIEGQLWQLAHLVNNAERNLASQRLNVTKSDDFILQGDFTMPGQIVYDSSTGIFITTTTPYLPELAFSPGSPVGTIKGITLSQYFIDVVSYIVNWQNKKDKNPNSLTNCTLNFDYNSLQYSGTLILPYTVEMGANGSIVESAIEWLTT
ncbi:hypothetical protein QUA71_26140 [Microcoleus sp. MON1_C5]|uniref:hypothetical protein n=1 Tax=Microcoleus sp. MON1_C5 TaxID=2818828 RepID=UPI002FCF1EFC